MGGKRRTGYIDRSSGRTDDTGHPLLYQIMEKDGRSADKRGHRHGSGAAGNRGKSSADSVGRSVGQNYATYETQDGSTYEIWLEDAQSIAEKVKLVPKYNLAGIAQWKLGFENSSIWQVISDNLQ